VPESVNEILASPAAKVVSELKSVSTSIVNEAKLVAKLPVLSKSRFV